MLKFTIYGRLPSINEYTAATRANRYKGASMKANAQNAVVACILSQIGRGRLSGQVFIHYAFYEPNMRRDLDNISGFAHKVIQDALVACGVLKDDGWQEIAGMADQFFVDKKNPRIEVGLEVLDEKREFYYNSRVDD